jgi:hypothetical protein
MDVHRGWSHDNLEIFSRFQELFDEAQDDINAYGPFMCLVDD